MKKDKRNYQPFNVLLLRLKERENSDRRMTVQSLFFKWYIQSKPNLYTSSLESFFFNTRVSPSKILWLIKRMYEESRSSNVQSVVRIINEITERRSGKLKAESFETIKQFSYRGPRLIMSLVRRVKERALRDLITLAIKYRSMRATSVLYSGFEILSRIFDQRVKNDESLFVNLLKSENERERRRRELMTRMAGLFLRKLKMQILKKLIAKVFRGNLLKALLKRLDLILRKNLSRSQVIFLGLANKCARERCLRLFNKSNALDSLSIIFNKYQSFKLYGFFRKWQEKARLKQIGESLLNSKKHPSGSCQNDITSGLRTLGLLVKNHNRRVKQMAVGEIEDRRRPRTLPYRELLFYLIQFQKHRRLQYFKYFYIRVFC